MEIILFILILLLLFFTLNILYKRTNHYKNTIYQLKKYINGVPDELEIVNTGSSYARYAFDYSNINLKGFNFGLQPQSLSYDYRIIKQYSYKMKKGCIVLITLPNLVFGFLDYKNDQTNTKYYYFLDPKNILGFTKYKYLKRVIFPILSSQKNIFRIFKDVSLQKLYDQDKNFMKKEQIHADATARVEGWKKQFNLESTIENDLPDEILNMFGRTTELLNEIIEYCLNNNFRPVIVVPPTSAIINNLLSEKFMKKVLYDNIQKANKREIPVLDYLYDERFQDEALYINSDMLNKTGREKFTQVVLDDLKQLGVIGK
jgi:hypothetical protein